MGNQIKAPEIWIEPECCPTCGKTCEFWDQKKPECRGKLWLLSPRDNITSARIVSKEQRDFHEEHCGRRIHYHRCTWHFHEEDK